MSFLVDILTAMFRVSTPLALGSTGEVVTERSGVLNLGIEGTMYAGAFFGFYAAYQTDNRWIGLAAALALGAIAATLLGFLTVTLGVNQHTAGLGLTLFLIGLSEFVNRAALGTGSGSSLKVRTFGQLRPFGIGGVFAQTGLPTSRFWFSFRSCGGCCDIPALVWQSPPLEKTPRPQMLPVSMCVALDMSRSSSEGC